MDLKCDLEKRGTCCTFLHEHQKKTSMEKKKVGHFSTEKKYKLSETKQHTKNTSFYLGEKV